VQVTLAGLEVDVVLGAIVTVPSARSPATTTARVNRALARARDGSIASYDKERAFPLGERAPLEGTRVAEWFRRLSPRTGELVEGRGGKPFTLELGVVVPLVCYEDLLPSFVRARPELSRATLLVSLANDAWFDGSSAARLHATLARARAVEAGRTLVRSTTTGLSGAWGPDGRALALLPPLRDGATVVDVPLGTRSTPYLRWGPLPFAAALALALGLAALAARPRRLSPCRPS
jgi:apolipoprotein N-acyltransferase